MCIRDRDKRLPALKTEESQAVAQVQKLELEIGQIEKRRFLLDNYPPCLLYTSDAADERSSVDLGGRRIIKKKKQ